MNEILSGSEPQISVRSVALLTGLNEHTLRAWERRYGAVQPQRTATGRRFYSREDVERLRILAALAGRGYAIGQIAGLSDADLARMMADSLALQNQASDLEHLPSVSKAHSDIAATLKVIAQATSSYDLARVHTEIARARARYGARQFALELVSPLMSTVDQLILRGQFTIGQEHALTAILRANLLDILLTLHRSSLPLIDEPTTAAPAFGPPRTFALSTMEGDLHELGILISAVLCAYHGLAPTYIGPNMPPEALASAASAMQIGAVIIGVSPLPPGILPRSLADYVRILAAHLPATCEIWVGGRTDLDPKALKLPRTVRCIETLPDLDRLFATMAAAAVTTEV